MQSPARGSPGDSGQRGPHHWESQQTISTFSESCPRISSPECFLEMGESSAFLTFISSCPRDSPPSLRPSLPQRSHFPEPQKGVRLPVWLFPMSRPLTLGSLFQYRLNWEDSCEGKKREMGRRSQRRADTKLKSLQEARARQMPGWSAGSPEIPLLLWACSMIGGGVQ